jgi:hypothetical protein
MARVLLILSIVLTLATVGLGFVAKQNVDALKGDLKTSKQDASAAKAAETRAKTNLDAAKKESEQSKAALEAGKADLFKARSDVDEAQKKLADANAEVERQKLLLDGKQPPPPTVGTEQAEIDRLKGELTNAQTQLAESKQVQVTLEQRASEKEAALVDVQGSLQAYKNRIVRNGLSGRVLAFNPGWNFAVLSIGDKAGLKAGVSMVITRGNQMIAKARISSVEPNTSIADILPSTVARGQSVQPGDTVVYEGPR